MPDPTDSTAQSLGLPTLDQAFPGYHPPPPATGAANDAWWSNPTNPLGRIVDAAGHGFAQPFEGRPVGLSDTDASTLQKWGVLPDYKGASTNFFDAARDTLIRGGAQAADVAWNALPSLAGGVGGGLKQTGMEVAGQSGDQPLQVTDLRSAAGFIPAAAGELLEGVPKGYYPLEAFPGSRPLTADMRATDAIAARSVGALGEGEAGFYDAKPLSEENATARASAASEAGLEPLQAAPPPPDVHALARRIAPETFEQYDALNAEAGIHRATLASLSEERLSSPEAVEAQGQIDTIMGRVNNVSARLTNAARGRLEAAQARLDEALNTETPEMAAARGRVMDADFAMRDLAPDVSDAYRQAREMAPELPETAPLAQPEGAPKAEEEGTPQAAAEMAAMSQAEARTTAAAGASPEAQAEVAPGKVTGEETLGHPAERGAEAARETARATEAAGVPERVHVEPAQGTGETATRGLARHTEEDAVARGLASNFGDLPEYSRVSMADQARQATDLMSKDYETAKDIAMGRKSAPSGLLPESVYVAVEKRATAEGDVETLRQLATQSKLSTAATVMGQRIRTLGERERMSPVGAIQIVQQAREAAFVKRGGNLEAAKSATVAEIRAEVRAAASKPDAWKTFLESKSNVRNRFQYGLPHWPPLFIPRNLGARMRIRIGTQPNRRNPGPRSPPLSRGRVFFR